MFEQIASMPRLRFAIAAASSFVLSIATGVIANILYAVLKKDSFGFATFLSVKEVLFIAILFALWIVWTWFNLGLMNRDLNVEKFRDDAYCVAFARKSGLEAYAAMVKKNPDMVSSKLDKLFNDLGLKDDEDNEDNEDKDTE